ncbi:GntR family transcriptional regulator [Roseibium litorale]|uniref:GntR family transcriptional regulator n=1 Tax=Roseibium litorale TaxID=2803841 RepID=A0ABR9CKB5_9HYPH|nr:GntR family transcriptional regulator [Roseibium litorale]MBD8891178.1 GntR family transcriptional regulator [Roseibium litorale]
MKPTPPKLSQVQVSPEDPRPRKRRNRAPNSGPTGPAHWLIRSNVSIGERLYKKIRTSIIELDLLPGTPISENAIAQLEGVSRTPVREAILRLAEERLVEVVPQSGSYVGRIPVSALPEAMLSRRALEMMLIKTATARATRDDWQQLEAHLALQADVACMDDIAGFHHLDDEFHELIGRIAGLPRVWEHVQEIKVQMDRFRRLTFAQAGRMDLVVREHTTIVEELKAGSQERAAKEMATHLTGLRSYIAKGVAQNPQYFIIDIDLDNLPESVV